MTFRREYFLVFLSPLMLVCLGVGYIQASRRAGTRAAEDVPGGALYREVMEIVQTRYVNEPDEERLIYGAAKGIMDELDRHSVVYTPEQWADNELRARGHYVGIGILVDKLEEMVSVLEVLPNGPAERAGLRHGDRIVMIDGFTVDHRKPISEAMTHLRGKPRTTAILKVKALGGDTVRIVKVRRGIAPNRLVYGYFLDREAGIGFVHIEAFRATTVDLFDQEVRQLIQQGMTSLVLDLRVRVVVRVVRAHLLRLGSRVEHPRSARRARGRSPRRPTPEQTGKTTGCCSNGGSDSPPALRPVAGSPPARRVCKSSTPAWWD